MQYFVRSALCIVVALVAEGLSAATRFDFVLSPASGVDIDTLELAADNSGTLIGDFDVVDNPTGTRTKPGIFGSFGATENVPVPVELDLLVTGMPNVGTSGGFTAIVDTATNTIAISSYSASLAPGPLADLDLSIGFSSGGFRTQSPNSVYPPGAATIPFGTATLTSLQITQIGSEVPTALTPLGPNTYQFSAAMLVSLELGINALGNPFVLPPLPLAITLTGELALAGDAATIVGMSPVAFDQNSPLNVALPEFPLPLPTILPPGGTANVLLTLTLASVDASLEGRILTSATGTAVPEPKGLALIAIFIATQFVKVTGQPRYRKLLRKGDGFSICGTRQRTTGICTSG